MIPLLCSSFASRTAEDFQARDRCPWPSWKRVPHEPAGHPLSEPFVGPEMACRGGGWSVWLRRQDGMDARIRSRGLAGGGGDTAQGVREGYRPQFPSSLSPMRDRAALPRTVQDAG